MTAVASQGYCGHDIASIDIEFFQARLHNATTKEERVWHDRGAKNPTTLVETTDYLQSVGLIPVPSLIEKIIFQELTFALELMRMMVSSPGRFPRQFGS